MVENKVVILGCNDFQILWVPLDLTVAIIYNGHNRTSLNGCKKLSHIEGDSPRDDPKFEARISLRHSMKKNFVACYDIESKIFNSRQRTLSITKYYGTLNKLWIELDQCQRLKMCKVDSIAYIELVKLPSLFEVFSNVLGEETRWSVMLDKGSSNIGSSMAIGKGSIKGSTFEGKPFSKTNCGEYCRYCKRLGPYQGYLLQPLWKGESS
ncbi:hypothetical protein CR513_09957, partial [Mucuna pruriens]